MSVGVARDVLRMVGPARTVLHVVPWLVRRRYIFYALTLPVADRSSSGGVDLTIATDQDLARLAWIRPQMYTLSQIEERIRDGHLPLIARRGEAVVHIRWVFTRTVYVPYLRRRLVLEDGDVLLDEIYTLPEWRRTGVERAVAVAMPPLLYRMGYRRVLGIVASWNLAPQRVAESFGYVRLGSCGYWTLPGLRRHIWEGAVEERPDGMVIVGRRAPAGREHTTGVV
ncbi:MAG: hypothetical protein QN178_08890 [Armatimonadota bacterium]|nr:hypothetical protein [Armatimonadota bacterium]